MKLKKAVSCAEFLKSAQACRGEVVFETPEGDQLNLKSTLSEYLFLTASLSGKLLEAGSLRFQYPDDQKTLTQYLEEESVGILWNN